MLQDVLGNDMFKLGMQNYIAENRFGNVLTPNFLDSKSIYLFFLIVQAFLIYIIYIIRYF